MQLFVDSVGFEPLGLLAKEECYRYITPPENPVTESPRSNLPTQ